MERTRLLFLGDSGLANGFRLAGFEVFPDADVPTLERLLRELQEERQPAFVIIDYRLAESDSRVLQQVRDEGGRILITQVPPLQQAGNLRSKVDQRINQLLGNGLETRT
jgi:vacuolar-type H+-ATPase subunit F/Vma7